MSTIVATPKVTRPTSGRAIAGVAKGLADHVGLPVWVVRVAFVVLAFAGGIGIVLYGAFWAVVPLAPDVEDPEELERLQKTDSSRLFALAALAVGLLLLLAALGVTSVGGAVVPLIVAIVGAALVWQQADDDQRAAWSQTAARAARETAGTTARAGRWRVLVGVGLVVLGLVGLLVSRTGPAVALQSLATAVLLLVGIALVVFPWIYRWWREQNEQRRALIRSEERAEVAAHVHDSVLQTLTLIQRNAADSAEVLRLARAEERALRSWLYAPTGDPERTFAAAVQRDAAEVEAAYAATIDVVTVGDAPIDARLGAVLAASREAMVNAAKHGGGVVSVYAEVSDVGIEVFVKDRGPGFDPAGVPDDRHGVRESIIGRMERNAGRAEIISGPGQGCEVRLSLTRTEEAS